jgi:hypothetical protein
MMGRPSGPEKTILMYIVCIGVHDHSCMRIIIHSGGGNGKYNGNYYGDHFGHHRKSCN